MLVTTEPAVIQSDRPIKLLTRDFSENKYAYYRQMLEQAPIWRGSIAVMKLHLIPGYEDCRSFVQDPRFVRNRTTATGGSRFPFPLPRSLSLVAESMIISDGSEHSRLRGLVNKGFTSRSIQPFAMRIEELTHELLDRADKTQPIDLIRAYCSPIPMTVISEMVGIPKGQMPRFTNSLRVLTKGFSGWNVLRTLLWDLRGVAIFFETLIAEKRADPQDDILTRLIEAEEDGDRLSQNELIATVFLLILAGYETTTHLIGNGVITLLEYPDQLERLRAEPALIDSAIEEIQRHRGPIHGSKPGFALENTMLHGTLIKKGSPVMPLFGAANHDPRIFDKPDEFDIARESNRHLGFGFGEHFCLGAQLARMEARIAIRNLIERHPNLRLAVSREDLKPQRIPLWHRYEKIPVILGLSRA
jgi:cytochrome P450